MLTFCGSFCFPPKSQNCSVSALKLWVRELTQLPFLSLSGLGNPGAHVRSAGVMVTRLPHSLPLPEDLVGSFPSPSLQQPRDSRTFTSLGRAGIEPTRLRNPSVASSGRPRFYSLTSSCALPACLELESEVQKAQLTTHRQQQKLPRSLSSHHAALYRTVALPDPQLLGRSCPSQKHSLNCANQAGAASRALS